MPYIDADSHVYEVEETWDYLPKKYRHRRPVAVTILPKDAPYMGVDNSFWLVDGKAMQWTLGAGHHPDRLSDDVGPCRDEGFFRRQPVADGCARPTG